MRTFSYFESGHNFCRKMFKYIDENVSISLMEEYLQIDHKELLSNKNAWLEKQMIEREYTRFFFLVLLMEHELVSRIRGSHSRADELQEIPLQFRRRPTRWEFTDWEKRRSCWTCIYFNM